MHQPIGKQAISGVEAQFVECSLQDGVCRTFRSGSHSAELRAAATESVLLNSYSGDSA